MAQRTVFASKDILQGSSLIKFGNRDVNGIIKNSLKMPGSRGHIGPGGVKGQSPCGGPKGAFWEKLNFHTSTT